MKMSFQQSLTAFPAFKPNIMTQHTPAQDAVYSNVVKGGRCWNGFQMDAGMIIHAVQGLEPNGFWGDKALCGTQPGYRGYGWSLSQKEVSCPKCKKKLESINKATL